MTQDEIDLLIQESKQVSARLREALDELDEIVSRAEQAPRRNNG